MLFVVCGGTDAEIEGTSQELQDLSRSIRKCESLSRIPLSVPATFDDRGLRYLTELVIKVDSGALKISEVDQQLLVSGTKKNLDLFSANIDALVTQTEGVLLKRDHLHVEFYPGHFFLSEDALPLVLIRQD